MRIGAHMSVAGGIINAVERAEEIGANALQIFSSPPQQWKSSVITAEQATAFKQIVHTKDILPIFVHGTYLINLASENEEIVQKSKQSLIADLHFCHTIGSMGVIFHFGSAEHGWNGKKNSLIDTIYEILSATPEDTYFIIENAAGNGHKIGSSVEELCMMNQDISHPRIKFCIDTAHAFAAGYEFRTSETAKKFVDTVETTIGWKQIIAIHLNDSKVDIGKKRDLHQNIGEGYIGERGFRSLFTSLPNAIPLILETPGDGEGPNRENVERVKRILTTGV